MLLFVGLGNPTPNSENNRHNIGFKIIDAINNKFKLSKQKPKFKGLLTTGSINNKKVYAIKPLTFMNNSGICIRDSLITVGAATVAITKSLPQLFVVETL